jgi:hypothetical protein
LSQELKLPTVCAWADKTQPHSGPKKGHMWRDSVPAQWVIGGG